MKNVEKKKTTKTKKLKKEIIREEVVQFLGRDTIYALGIDQGYANLGFSIVKYNILEDKTEILDVKGLTTPASKCLNKRILDIYDFTRSLLLDSEYGKMVDVLGCEKLFYNQPMKVNKDNELKATFILRNKSASILKTNMVTGILYLISAELDKEIFEYPPTTVKKHIVGNGRSSKEELNKNLNTIIEDSGLEVKTDHQSDSIGIAITTAKEYCQYIYKNFIKK